MTTNNKHRFTWDEKAIIFTIFERLKTRKEREVALSMSSIKGRPYFSYSSVWYRHRQNQGQDLNMNCRVYTEADLRAIKTVFDEVTGREPRMTRLAEEGVTGRSYNSLYQQWRLMYPKKRKRDDTGDEDHHQGATKKSTLLDAWLNDDDKGAGSLTYTEAWLKEHAPSDLERWVKSNDGEQPLVMCQPITTH